MSADADAASSSSSPLCPEGLATGSSSSCAGAQEVTESVAINANNNDSNNDFPSEMEPLNCEDPAPLGPDPNDDITDDMSELLTKLKLSNMKNAIGVPASSSSSAGIEAAASEEEDANDVADTNSATGAVY